MGILFILEDCLLLNVYVFVIVYIIGDLLVMVWFYGGVFVMGLFSFFDVSNFFGFGNVVVVIVNYRLGLIGFLVIDDDILKGNYGLWD